MPGVIIYKTKEPKHYYGFVFSDQPTYRSAKRDIRANKDEILWKKGNVGHEQAKNVEETMNGLIKRLNEDDKINLETELTKLEGFFECGESH